MKDQSRSLAIAKWLLIVLEETGNESDNMREELKALEDSYHEIEKVIGQKAKEEKKHEKAKERQRQRQKEKAKAEANARKEKLDRFVRRRGL